MPLFSLTMTDKNPPSVTVCICTYRRASRLAELLGDLAAQTRLPDEVVVVDNDAPGSARATVEAFAISAPFPLRYDVQPVKNISLTRNRTVALASGEWIAMLDDDERVVPEWLALLLKTAQEGRADGVLAPVVCLVPDTAPAWIRAGKLYALPRFKTGTVPPLNRIGIGNALLRGSLLRKLEGPFDPRFGLTGGEDADVLTRLVQEQGARFLWCDEALATEPVEESRLNLTWLMRRSLRGGQDHAKHKLAGRFGPVSPLGRVVFVGKSLAQLMASPVVALAVLPAGRHHAVEWLKKTAGNYGKLTALFGAHYQEYK